MTVLAVATPGWVLIAIVVVIVLTLVYFLVATILELRKITAGLDDAPKP
ncbi:MAG: hypothetical protein QOE38_112 [Thermoleophilaceae bacterium]|nr:hypothetical protein [Thermoleophilaceae bacterium]